MTLAEYSLMAFALLNGARVAAYVPQLHRVYHDPNGASAISIATWSLFASANIATVAYALAVAGDRLVAFVFVLNTIGCMAIVLATIFKRLKATPSDQGILTSSGESEPSASSSAEEMGVWRREVSKRLQDAGLCRVRINQWE